MIASTHLAAGALSGLLGQKCLPQNSGVAKRIAAGFLSGFVSHIILDAIPHEDYGLHGYELGSVLLPEVLVVFWLIFYPARGGIINWIFFFSMAGAAFPDLLSLGHQYMFGWQWLHSAESFLHILHANPSSAYKISVLGQSLLALSIILGVRRIK